MKSNRFQRRFYRDWVKADDLYLAYIAERETDLEILTNRPIDRDFVLERIRSYRFDIENYINKDKRFLTALKPISIELNAPGIIKEMARQAEKVNVGPMASVAGAVAEFLGKDLLRQGFKDVIVENGGDIFLKTTKLRAVGIYAGKSRLWNKLKIKIRSKDTPLGICASSGTIGHSLSFGLADSVIILAKKTALADAVATACANRVKSKDDLQITLDFAKSIEGVLGCVLIIKNKLVSWGSIEFLS